MAGCPLTRFGRRLRTEEKRFQNVIWTDPYTVEEPSRNPAIGGEVDVFDRDRWI